MPNFKVILFICNWGPHAAYQTLQEQAERIPAEVRMVRIPCSGRITKALLFKPFEMGADGAALLACEEGTCRYGTGTENARRNVEDTRGILDLLGLGKERLRLAHFLPDQHEGLLNFLIEFVQDIRELGTSPVRPPLPVQRSGPDPEEVRRLVQFHDVYACQDCGKCASACPLTLAGKPFSPRAMAGRIIEGRLMDPDVQRDVWTCLTCGLCVNRCPSAVNFPLFIRDMRRVLHQADSKGAQAHGGFFQSLARTMTAPDLPVRHWDWLPSDIHADPDSKTLFFGGCAAYFDLFFRTHLGVHTRSILTDSLRLLNFFDIHPALLPHERCCGHDLLWSGDVENFRKLARINVDAIHERGIEEMIVCCPEGYQTFVRDCPDQGIPIRFKVTHIYEVLEREIDKGSVGFKPLHQRLTFQDPCRLSRMAHRPDLPRKLLDRLAPASFAEMRDHGEGAVCCGNCAWTGCDGFAKAMQVSRIQQARETGADLLVTACPKCQIHLRCSMEDPFVGEELQMEIMDLTNVLAKTMEWK